MAQFTSLYHAGEVLAHVIRTRLGLTTEQVIVGPPREQVLDTSKHMRVSLLWVNEQPTHRNDPPARNFDGSRTPPPLSLWGYYLLSAHGNTSLEEHVEAHETLGDAMRALHDEQELSLPLGDLPGRGEGRLAVSLVPLSPELIEKLFGPLQLKHRPFALYEVGPVQLISMLPAIAPRPVVLPGGVRLVGPRVAPSRPALSRAVPLVQGAGGGLRLDGVFPAAPTHVLVGKTVISGGDIQVVDGARSIRFALPAAVGEGTHRVSVTAGGLSSDPVEIQVVAATHATLDGPAAITHSKGSDLVLTGRGLATATEVVAWPDGGVREPSDVVTLPLAGAASATQITVAAASLGALADSAYRFAARVGTHSFTPYVVLEVAP